MRNKKGLLAILLIVALSGIFVHAQMPTDAKLKEVDVYFWFIGTEGIEDEILPLKRKVSAAAPLRPAIEEMLKVPTEAEQKLGYVSTSYGDLKLVSVKIKRGTARIDFSRIISDGYNPGDLQTLKFESAVKKTALQFSAVKKVVVCVNGMNEFGIGLVEDAPRPCPKEK
jgi:spore germination protein GerM